jgi:ATP-dependent RNA helicase DHX37/DHR1
MTDGILLQEIQSDLLLRKYGAIVIDEAHERNLNTDVLLGLLSVALPLRRKAAAEGSLPPLKLVIMSATLKVEDFTENARLFPRGDDGVVSQPVLVKVPGRTFPVSIHHSKVTELDNYGEFSWTCCGFILSTSPHTLALLPALLHPEKAALDKTCKIHRKLPPGGILVFLTGKQEVVRMVNRLKRKLEPREKKFSSSRRQVEEGCFEECIMGSDALDGFRDMDDEEVDGDLFQKEDHSVDDFDEAEQDNDVVADRSTQNDNDKQPKKIRVLPLYSMLSADEQAKVFASVPEDTRLIVVATNIAESEIISYLVLAFFDIIHN